MEPQLITPPITHDQVRQLNALPNYLSKQQEKSSFYSLTHRQIAKVMSPARSQRILTGNKASNG